jgi:hypothetical protein
LWLEVTKEIANRGGMNDFDIGVNGNGALHIACESRAPIEVIECLLERKEVDPNRVDEKSKISAALLAIRGETDDYQTKALELFKKGYEKDNGPRLLIDFLYEIGGPPGQAILWLVEYLRDQGSPIRPNDTPMVGSGRNERVKDVLKRRLESVNRFKKWYGSMEKAYEIVMS